MRFRTTFHDSAVQRAETRNGCGEYSSVRFDRVTGVTIK